MQCAGLLPLTDLDVVVSNEPWRVIPRIGSNGFSHGRHHISLYIDVDHPHFMLHGQSDLRSLLAHELHHSSRDFLIDGSHGKTYGENLIAEGLACCFEEEVGQPTPFYAIECKGEALSRFATKAEEQFATPIHQLPGGWERWKFGTQNDPEFPYQCGYSLGFAMVRRWLDDTMQTASNAVGADAAAPLAHWRSGRPTPPPAHP